MYCIGVFFLPQERAPKAGRCHLFILFLFFEIWNTVFNFKTSLQNLAAGIQKNTHKSMSTLGTIVYNSDLFSDINTINTMAAALYFHEQQKVWCVLAMEQGKTFVEVCQEFRVKERSMLRDFTNLLSVVSDF